MPIPALISELRNRNTLIVVNHSGGKDSQAMLVWLAERDLLAHAVVVHASLGEMEWHGALETAQRDAETYGLPFVVARAGKSLLEMVERRFQTRPGVPSWPSASTRQCTSDLKRDPIAKAVRKFADDGGYDVIVNCTGIRAQESAARAKKDPLRLNKRETNTKRTWYEWLPIFDYSVDDVWAAIETAGLEPHPAYAAGNERLSCVFCVMASVNDLRNGARHRPELALSFIQMEERTGYTMHMSRKPLRELIGDALNF